MQPVGAATYTRAQRKAPGCATQTGLRLRLGWLQACFKASEACPSANRGPLPVYTVSAGGPAARHHATGVPRQWVWAARCTSPRPTIRVCLPTREVAAHSCCLRTCRRLSSLHSQLPPCLRLHSCPVAAIPARLERACCPNQEPTRLSPSPCTHAFQLAWALSRLMSCEPMWEGRALQGPPAAQSTPGLWCTHHSAHRATAVAAPNWQRADRTAVQEGGVGGARGRWARWGLMHVHGGMLCGLRTSQQQGSRRARRDDWHKVWRPGRMPAWLQAAKA
jgi:hypothetical protein